MPLRSPTWRWSEVSAVGCANSSAKTTATPMTYQASRRRTGGLWPRTGSSYSAAPKRCASTRSITSSSVSTRPTSTRRSVSISEPPAVAGSRGVGAEHGQERLLRDLDRTDPLHPALALLLLLEQLPLPGYVATVALGDHVLAHRAHRLPGDDVRA